IVVLLLTVAASAQKANDAITKQIKSLKAERFITLTYDAGSNASKIFVRADNFSDSEAKKAGIQAMNFGMACNYAGQSLAAPPETFDLAFWVLTKKPRFASANSWTVPLGSLTLDLGDARYGAKPAEDMEYLNFHVSREDLGKIAAAPKVKFHLGAAEFTFMPSQLTLFKDLLAITGNN
ncbi:MAG: hypothetical protein ABJB40_08870, partial [Acidobacteriota bacterium]